MSEYRYTVLFEPAEEGGYVATCPALPGLVTEGDTLDEVRVMVRDAIKGFPSARPGIARQEMMGYGQQLTRRRFLGGNECHVGDDAIVPLVARKTFAVHTSGLAGVNLTNWDSGVWNIAHWTKQ